MEEQRHQENEMPEKFASIMTDFLRDLSTTFPEYSYLWERYTSSTEKYRELYDYCLTVYPERFFDILYQNDEIFLVTSSVNTMFLPNVEFKMLFSVPDISENTKQTMWKYLQLIMVTIMGNIKSSASFGDAASIFEGIDETELQSKLSETINGLSDFFKNINPEEFEKSGEYMDKAFEDIFESGNNDTENNESSSGEEKQDNGFFSGMPNVDELHNHIKGLFDGKIGSLAKELAEELSGDMMHMFDDGEGEVKTAGDIMKKMMKDPKKIMELVKKISGKLDAKMKSGNISQEELMKEAGDLFGKMKGMGNGKEFQNMMKGMMKTMNPMMASMMGKNAKMDMNKLQTEMAKTTHKERMMKKLEKNRALAQAQAQANFVLQSTSNPNEFVFKGAETQEKSVARHDDWLDDTPQAATGTKTSKSKKTKTKTKK